MAKVTLSIEGEPHEIHEALRQLFAADYRFLADSPTLADGDDEALDTSDEQPIQAMTPAEVEQMWGEIKKDSRMLLEEFASRPDGYPLAEIAQHLGVERRAIGGQLSSIGFALKRLGIPKEHQPLIRTTRNGEITYRMNWDVARTIRVMVRLAHVRKELDRLEKQEEHRQEREEYRRRLTGGEATAEEIATDEKSDPMKWLHELDREEYEFAKTAEIDALTQERDELYMILSAMTHPEGGGIEYDGRFDKGGWRS